LGRAPTQIERLTETHLKKKKNTDNSDKIWVTKEAENLQEVYAKDLCELNGLDPAAPVNGILHPGCGPVSDPGLKIWEAAVGGVNRGRLKYVYFWTCLKLFEPWYS
jgi:hypothetical protein